MPDDERLTTGADPESEELKPEGYVELKPEGYVSGESPPAYHTDPTFYRIVAVALSLAVLGGVGGAITLTLLGKESPEILLAVGSAAVGALAGVLRGDRG